MPHSTTAYPTRVYIHTLPFIHTKMRLAGHEHAAEESANLGTQAIGERQAYGTAQHSTTGGLSRAAAV